MGWRRTVIAIEANIGVKIPLKSSDFNHGRRCCSLNYMTI